MGSSFDIYMNYVFQNLIFMVELKRIYNNNNDNKEVHTPLLTLVSFHD